MPVLICFYSRQQGNEVLQKCSVLMKLDYSVVEVSNATGDLSTHYPGTLLIPEYELQPLSQSNSVFNSSQTSPPRQDTIYESTYDAGKLRESFLKARFAR